jgi:adenylylsulfate kinase
MSNNLVKHQSNVTRVDREVKNGHRGAVIWLTGLSGSGKSTLAHGLEEVLHSQGYRTYVLDGDNVRHGLCNDLGFTHEARSENIRRIGEVAKLFMDAGFIVITAFISPFREDRDDVRKGSNPNDFIEVYCDSPIDVCENRDVKGIYKKARNGEILEFTGISSPYDVPEKPDLIINTSHTSVTDSLRCLVDCVTAMRPLTNGVNDVFKEDVNQARLTQ